MDMQKDIFSLAKGLHYLHIPKKRKIEFFLMDIKTMYFNQYHRFNYFKVSLRPGW